MPEPILDYAPPPKKRSMLRGAAAFLLRVLGCIYAILVVGTANTIVHSTASLADWVVLLLTLPTAITFLATGFNQNRAITKWHFAALLAALVNIGVVLSCLAGTFFRIPQFELDPDLIREISLLLGTIIFFILLALALMLFLILRQSKRQK
jgi:hypothetical protein